MSQLLAKVNVIPGLEVEAGRFRRDLYYRLRGVILRIPSLRERPADIGVLTEHYLDLYCSRYGKSVSLDDGARATLRAYKWPGNVRELKSLMEAVVVASENGNAIGEKSINRFLPAGTAPEPETLPELERREIQRALSACGGNKAEAARRLGISRKTLYQKLRSFEIQ